jgi:hypothetical protein
MKKTFIYFIMLLSAISFIGMACSDKTDQETEKGMIEEMTDNAAKKAASHLTAPLDRARDAQKVGQDHIDEMEDALNE